MREEVTVHGSVASMAILSAVVVVDPLAFSLAAAALLAFPALLGPIGRAQRVQLPPIIHPHDVVEASCICLNMRAKPKR